MTVFARIVKQHRDTKLQQDKIGTTEQIRQQLISAIVLSLLFGLGWGFALPATQGINNTAVQILFQAIYIALTAFQGVFIFIMHCLVGRKSIIARQEWKHWVRRVSRRRSSTYSSADYTKSTLDRVHRRFKRSGTLGSSITSDSTLQRESNLYDTLPRKTPLSSVLESESMFNSSVVELATLECNEEEKPVTIVAGDASNSTILFSDESPSAPSQKLASRKKHHVSFSEDNPLKTSDELLMPPQRSDHEKTLQNVQQATAIELSLEVGDTYQATLGELHMARISTHAIEEAKEKEEEEEGTLEEDVFVNPVAKFLDHNETSKSAIISPSPFSYEATEATEAFKIIWSEVGQTVLPQRSAERETSADCSEGVHFENPFTAMEEGLQESDLVSDGKTVMEGDNSNALMMPEGEATAMVITNPLALGEEGKVPNITMKTDDKDAKCSKHTESVGDIARMADTDPVWTGSEMTLTIGDMDMDLGLTPFVPETDDEEYTTL